MTLTNNSTIFASISEIFASVGVAIAKMGMNSLSAVYAVYASTVTRVQKFQNLFFRILPLILPVGGRLRKWGGGE